MTEITTELFYDDDWHDISADVYNRDAVPINRGRPDETGTVKPGIAKLTLDNRTGRYSSRNPRSDLFGKIGRNTPLRVRVGDADPSPLVLPGLQTAYVSTPAVSELDIAGDLDLRIDLEPDDWAGSSDPAVPFALANHRWQFEIFNDGVLRFRWSDEPTGDPKSASSTVGISQIDPRRALRITIDVDNGASGNTVTFYTSDTLAGTWTQLGAPITQAFVTGFSVISTTDLELGRDAGAFDPAEPFAGILHGFELRDGIDGTVVANPDFTALDPAPSFTDAAGRTWTIVGAAIIDPSIRSVGEVAAWPQDWEPSGADVYTQIEAAGILRRLGQGASPIGSALKRALLASTGTPLIAYWPCEDLAGATEFASALSGAGPIVPNPLPDFASSNLFAASEPLPVMTQDNDSEWNVAVPNYIPTLVGGEGQCSFLFHVDGGALSGNQGVLGLVTEGPAVGAFHLVLTSAGFFRLDLHNEDGVLVDSSGLTSETVTNRLLYINLSYQAGGANISYNVRFIEIGQGESFTGLTGSHPVGAGMGKVKGLVVNNRAGLTAAGARLTLGHISFQGDQDLPEFLDRAEAFNAYAGEHALSRIQRLSAEEDEPFTFTDDPALTTAMGAQLPKTFLELIGEAEVADQGILYESRGASGLAYRSRAGLYNQDPVLDLTYGDGAFRSTPTPIDDDQRTRNDITVTRQGGSSARLRQAFGTLSVQPPPNGVGRYDEGVTVNLAADGQLPNDVAWRLGLGTVDEARYPSLHLQLIAPAYTANPALTANAVALDIGDRIVINNPPEWLPPEQISVLVQGFTETLSLTTRDIVINTAPESPYRVGVYAEDDTVIPPDAPSRYSSAGTVTIVEFVSGTDTALEVGTLVRPYWTEDPADMPFDILVSGVRLRVTAISAPVGDFQNMTIQAAPINGIIKTIPIVSVVALFQPAVYAL